MDICAATFFATDAWRCFAMSAIVVYEHAEVH
jgi:hypothetical protein